MLAQVGVNRFSFIYSNIGATPVSTTPGTSVVPGASDVEGSWTEIATSSNISQDIYFLWIVIGAGATTSTVKDHLLDIGVDPAGGTSYVAIISNIACGQSTAFNTGMGLYFQFPIFIKSGSSVAVRVQGSAATAGTVRIVATFYGQPSHPELFRVGRYSETVGTITGSAGVGFTPGDTGAEGTYQSLGTLAKACWWWQLGVQLSNGTISALKIYHFDLAYGDGSNKHIIIQDLRVIITTSEQFQSSFIPYPCYADLPAGTELWVRGTCSTTIDSGWNAVAIGIGG